jgi:uncharacterized protein (DUF4415 family)
MNHTIRAAMKTSASSLQGKPMATKQGNTVKRTLDLAKKPMLTAEQKARLDAVAAMPDEQIDYKDAPYLPNAVWMKAAAKLPSAKQQITLRIDAEVLEFFRHTGARYQSRINAVLHAYVKAHKAQQAHAS